MKPNQILLEQPMMRMETKILQKQEEVYACFQIALLTINRYILL